MRLLMRFLIRFVPRNFVPRPRPADTLADDTCRFLIITAHAILPLVS